MEWWQILIIVFVAGLFIEETVSIIAKAIVFKSMNKDKDDCFCADGKQKEGKGNG